MTAKEELMQYIDAQKHKKYYKFILIITYLMFFPFAIIQILSDIFEKLIGVGCSLRDKTIKFFMYLIVKLER